MSDAAEHFKDCTGNGSEDCWDCGGEGTVDRALSDDPDDVVAVRCETCGGTGAIVCPGCSAADENVNETERTRP